MHSSHSEHLAVARTSLLRAKDALSEEISAYPTPISGCDAQFNHLLSERIKISQALDLLKSEPFVPTPRRLATGARMESR
jgi:hypothetical protein